MHGFHLSLGALDIAAVERQVIGILNFGRLSMRLRILVIATPKKHYHPCLGPRGRPTRPSLYLNQGKERKV